MLPFGSITSLVPLTILALAYLVYISASVLNKNVPESSQKTGEVKVYAGSVSETRHHITYHELRHTQDNDTDDDIAVPGSFHFRDYSRIFFHEATYGELVGPHSVSPFSPRPPPAA